MPHFAQGIISIQSHFFVAITYLYYLFFRFIIPTLTCYFKPELVNSYETAHSHRKDHNYEMKNVCNQN